MHQSVRSPLEAGVIAAALTSTGIGLVDVLETSAANSGFFQATPAKIR